MIIGYVDVGPGGLKLVERRVCRSRSSTPLNGRRGFLHGPAELALSPELYIYPVERGVVPDEWPGKESEWLIARFGKQYAFTSVETVERAKSLVARESRLRVLPAEALSRVTSADELRGIPERGLNRSHRLHSFRYRRRWGRTRIVVMLAVVLALLSLVAAIIVRQTTETPKRVAPALSLSRPAWEAPHHEAAMRTSLSLLEEVIDALPEATTFESVLVDAHSMTAETVGGPGALERTAESTFPLKDVTVEQWLEPDGTMFGMFRGTCIGDPLWATGAISSTAAPAPDGRENTPSRATLLAADLRREAVLLGLEVRTVTIGADPEPIRIVAAGTFDDAIHWLNVAERHVIAARQTPLSVEISHTTFSAEGGQVPGAGLVLSLTATRPESGVIQSESAFHHDAPPGSRWPEVDLERITRSFTQAGRFPGPGGRSPGSGDSGGPGGGNELFESARSARPTGRVTLIGVFNLKGGEVFALRFNETGVVRTLGVGERGFGNQLLAATESELLLEAGGEIFSVDRQGL